MRILFAITTDLESPAGLGRYLPWAKQLAQDGHEVHIAALHQDLGRVTQHHFQVDGVQVHYVGQMHVRKQGDTTLYFGPVRLVWTILHGAFALARQAMRIAPDVIHVGKPHPQNVFAGLVAGRILGRRLLLLDYDDLEAESNHTSNGMQRRTLAWLERWFPRRCDGVTTHTRFLADRLLAAGVPAPRILRLPSAVDAARFRPVDPAQVAQRRRQLGLDASQFVVIYVGSFSLANHPVDLLLQAFALLAQNHPQARLLLVGGGPDLESLRRLAETLGIAQRCHFLGRVPADQIPVLFALADVSVDPVHKDPVAEARWPLKIIESLAVGVPVVTGKIGDRGEMLGAAGLLVQPGDAAALAQGLGRVLADPALLLRLGQNCALALAPFDSTKIAATLADFYAFLSNGFSQPGADGQ